MKVRVSVIVPVYNEEKNMRRCLASVSWADEIFVVDSGSSDGTCRVAEKLGAKVVRFEYSGAWPKKKNWALENLPFRNEWVFIIDADEELPPEAEEEFRVICERGGTGYDGYYINRRFFFMGKCLRHAYFPNWNLRLFKHARGRYEKLIDSGTSWGDNEVHEHIKLDGRSGRLKTVMNHYAFPDVETFMEKHNRYSSWEAQVAVSRGWSENSSGHLSGDVRLKRLLKKISMRMQFRPFLRFFYVLVVQRGFLDGREGYYFARLHSIYEALCVMKTYQLRKAGTK